MVQRRRKDQLGTVATKFERTIVVSQVAPKEELNILNSKINFT